MEVELLIGLVLFIGLKVDQHQLLQLPLVKQIYLDSFVLVALRLLVVRMLMGLLLDRIFNMATEILRPNGNGNNIWDFHAYTLIDDAIEAPSTAGIVI
jgi:hypothetical protein